MAERVLFVHAHPDDGGGSAGATAAMLVARGADVQVHTCPRGEFGELALNVAEQIQATRPDVVLTFSADGAKGHPDNTLVFDAVRTAAAAYGVPFYVIGSDKSGAEVFERLRPDGNGFSSYGPFARILTYVLVFVLGGFVGITLTMVSAQTVTVGGVPVPWGIIAGVVITAALLVGLRLVFESWLVPAIAALGLIAASVLLAVQVMSAQ